MALMSACVATILRYSSRVTNNEIAGYRAALCVMSRSAAGPTLSASWVPSGHIEAVETTADAGYREVNICCNCSVWELALARTIHSGRPARPCSAAPAAEARIKTVRTAPRTMGAYLWSFKQHQLIVGTREPFLTTCLELHPNRGKDSKAIVIGTHSNGVHVPVIRTCQSEVIAPGQIQGHRLPIEDPGPSQRSVRAFIAALPDPVTRRPVVGHRPAPAGCVRTGERQRAAMAGIPSLFKGSGGMVIVEVSVRRPPLPISIGGAGRLQFSTTQIYATIVCRKEGGKLQFFGDQVIEGVIEDLHVQL